MQKSRSNEELNWKENPWTSLVCCSHSFIAVDICNKTAQCYAHSGKKKEVIWWVPWRCEGIGAVCCTHMNPVVHTELRRTLGFLTKKPCILLEDLMRPQPFVSLGVASNFCLKQTSTRRQNKSLDPINYRTYQIFCKCFHFVVMLNYALLAQAALA